MDIKGNIKKILFILVWCIAGGGVLALLIAAINMKNSKTCKNYRVEFSGKGRPIFIDQRQVISLLTGDGSMQITGRKLVSFDLRKMEELLKKNVWIRDAQLFFDNNQTLRINVTEREPIARIFTVGGGSFYIDSSCTQLPLPVKSALRLPVFTGFPAERIRLYGPDSALSDQIRKLSQYILKEPFWSADIQQINITPKKTFEMVPTVGNHLILFGDGNEYEKKFQRLFIFYGTMLSKTGFDKYSRLDVEFAGQVIGTRKGSNISKSDSLQVVRNILQLIKQASQLQADTVRQNIKPLEHNIVTEQTLTNYDMVGEDEDSVPKTKKKK